MRDNRNDETPYAVICQGSDIPGTLPCGRVFLTEEQHDQQLARSNAGWHCPKCGGSAEWDDSCQLTDPNDGADEYEPATSLQFCVVSPADVLRLLGAHATAMCKAMHAVGSRVTCDPPPTDTDADYLVLVDRDAFQDFGDALEIDAGYEMGGSGDAPAWIEDEHFRSYRLGDVNVIVTDSTEFHKRFLAASSVARKFNLLQKPDRVALFQAVLYGNAANA